MRPVRLELEGFSTFRDRVELDFDGIDLVAFTGPTGAGKSTLIDAMTFALYGSVARYDNANRVAPVIHQLSNEARVRLDFESGGTTFTVVRVVRRRASKGREADGATTKEARLERIEADGSTTVLAGEVRELNTAVEEVLGLDFAQFTRTIVLPQGEFAAFLRDDQANRDRLLQRLLDLGIYERMGQLARARAKEAGIRIDMLADQRERLAPPTDDEVAALAARRESLTELQDRMDRWTEELEAIDAALDPCRTRVTEIDDAIERLAKIEVPDAVDGLERELRQTEEARAELDGAMAEARAARDAAVAAADALPEKADLVRIQSVAEQLTGTRADVDDLVAEAEELIERTASLAEEAERQERELAEAEAEVRTARQMADAAEWTASLEVGAPCPVCHQEVDSIPDHDPGGAVDAAEQRREAAHGAAKKVNRDLAKVTERDRLVADEIARQRERIDLLELQRSTLTGPDDPGEIAAVLTQIDEATAASRQAADRVTELEAELARVATAEQAAARAARDHQSALATLRDDVADLQPPSLGHESLPEDFRSLAAWATERRDGLGSERGELADEGRRLSRQRAELLESMTEAAAGIGLQAEPSGLVDAIGRASLELDGKLADANRRRDEDTELAARATALQADRILDEALGRHLRAGGFSSWLLAEALDSIVAKATTWLRELSDQQYSLVAGDRNFAIVDHNNADEVRDVRTLSGGETFLASLALALALADSIAELAPVDAPQLDSMFLDEGFGTLDPATLDIVAGAMEELASAGRMIGVVTHVADLAERMPTQFRVTKGPATSTVELVSQ